MNQNNYKNKIKKENMNSYRKTEVITSNREKILLMLYAGSIKFLKQAIEATKKDEELERISNIRKCQEIILELRSTLDYKANAEIASNLESLYSYIITCLIQGLTEKNIAPLESSLKILEDLNESWVEAINKLRLEKTAAK